ncbi:hypothetical protein K438DRAFT_1990284 [Mycena galopus ATCC 62051]|nr:hypothetical protein K438DRAFT_1990284 [Mycena galopus ATCC 62051]
MAVKGHAETKKTLFAGKDEVEPHFGGISLVQDGFDDLLGWWKNQGTLPSVVRVVRDILGISWPCPLPPCPSALTDLDAASAPAMYIRTDFVQSSRRRVHPSPPVPSPTMPLVAADRISEDLCAPLAPTCLGRAHRSPRSNDVVPSESGNRNEVHTPPPRNAQEHAHLRRYVIPTPFLSTNALILRKKVRLRLPPSPFDALLNHSTPLFINDTLRTRRGLINGRYEPLTTGARVPRVLRPSSVASVRLHHGISIHLSIFLHGASPATCLGSSTPSPLIQRRFSRSTFGEPPRIRLWRPQATIRLGNRPNARKIRTLRITSWLRPCRLPRPAHIDDPPPRSRPRPAPDHHDLATQALAMRRARPISTSIPFFSDWFLHTPARNARNVRPPRAFQTVTRHPSTQFCAWRRNCPHSESHYQLSMSRAPSISLI